MKKPATPKRNLKRILIWVLVALVLIGTAFAALVVYESSQLVAKKPAIYLYPENDSFISVELNINGQMTQDVPAYKEGWNVFVTKEGIIDGKYDYLFYEARLNKLELSESGWVVKYGDLEPWFDEYLSKLGLNEKEKSQFKDYWLKELPKSNYYEIKLLEDRFLKENMNLIVSPQPDTVIRLNFYFRPLKEKLVLQEPVIVTPEREGFTVVEWGGILGK
jgi:hypothetical protein